MTRVVGLLLTGVVLPTLLAAELLLLLTELGQFNSTLVKNRTWPVWPYEMPCKLDTICCRPLVELLTGRLSKTPALVPIQSRSLHANNEVMRRQADLCCRIISSQVDSILFTGLLTSISNSSSWLRVVKESVLGHIIGNRIKRDLPCGMVTLDNRGILNGNPNAIRRRRHNIRYGLWFRWN